MGNAPKQSPPLRFRKPRCVLLYAVAPQTTKPAEANRQINEMAADAALPLVLFHDHFLGEAGGVLLFYVANGEEREALRQSEHLAGWRVEWRPLIFSYSPAAFDAQIAFTLKRYRSCEWEALRHEQRPAYGSASTEAQTGQEEA